VEDACSLLNGARQAADFAPARVPRHRLASAMTSPALAHSVILQAKVATAGAACTRLTAAPTIAVGWPRHKPVPRALAHREVQGLPNLSVPAIHEASFVSQSVGPSHALTCSPWR